MENKKSVSTKLSQNDLRRLINQQRSKAEKKESEKIDSPLAKYDQAGKLFCVICRSNVKSSSVWKVHIHSKQHKQNVEIARSLKHKLTGVSSSRQLVSEKNSNIENNSITGKNNVYEIKCPNRSHVSHEDPLPEKFFDDPMKDAKIRNSEYKDPQDEEWERFQREMKEESTMSNAIIAGEQDKAAVVREIEEIDEQMKQWARFMHLEGKKASVDCSNKKRSLNSNDLLIVSQSDEECEEIFDEFPNWRMKKFHN